LAALSLWQDRFDLLDQRISFHLELDRRIAECGTEDDGTERHDRQRDDH
jgi:hypothetical protein